MAKLRTLEDEEISREFQKVDEEVARMIELKKREFSFEVREELQNFSEIDEVAGMVETAIENYRVMRSLGQFEEAREVRDKVKEMKYAQQHLLQVMNLDFNRPTPKMKALADEANIDLRDSRVLLEFKLIQQQNLTDIRRLKEGKPALTPEEISALRAKALEAAALGPGEPKLPNS